MEDSAKDGGGILGEMSGSGKLGRSRIVARGFFQRQRNSEKEQVQSVEAKLGRLLRAWLTK